jgi:transposase
MHGLVVTAADVQDRDMIGPMMGVARRVCVTIARCLADGGYQGAATAAEVLEIAGIPLEIVKRSDAARGFKVLPKRWIVERTFGWLGRCRRLAKDFEHHMRSHAAFVILAMIRLMLRRIIKIRRST